MPLKLFLDGPPKGVRVIILGGKPGSGVRTVAFKLREQLEGRDIAVEPIDDFYLQAHNWRATTKL